VNLSTDNGNLQLLSFAHTYIIKSPTLRKKTKLESKIELSIEKKRNLLTLKKKRARN
jgi:hypothetical protein